MIILTYIENLRTIGPVLSEIICLIRIRDGRQTDGQTDRRTETGNYFFRTVGVMKRRKNIKVAIRPMTPLVYTWQQRTIWLSNT